MLVYPYSLTESEANCYRQYVPSPMQASNITFDRLEKYPER